MRCAECSTPLHVDDKGNHVDRWFSDLCYPDTLKGEVAYHVPETM